MRKKTMTDDDTKTDTHSKFIEVEKDNVWLLDSVEHKIDEVLPKE